MTKTKLEIIGEYSKDHPGPFCTRDGMAARIICTNRKSKVPSECPVVALVDDGDRELVHSFRKDGKHWTGGTSFDLMNAREVPVPREFWVNEYGLGNFGEMHDTLVQAKHAIAIGGCVRTIHVREVLPGDKS